MKRSRGKAEIRKRMSRRTTGKENLRRKSEIREEEILCIRGRKEGKEGGDERKEGKK